VGDYTGTHTVIFVGFFLYMYYSPEGSVKLRWAVREGGGGGDFIFRVPNILEGCDGWGEGGEYYISRLDGTVERDTPLAAA
jgi:hypothetical protein